MHPLLMIVVLWLAVGVTSFLTALALITLLPIGPFLAAAIALIVGLLIVFAGLLYGRERTVRFEGSQSP